MKKLSLLKLLILTFLVNGWLNADPVSFVHEGYTSTYAAENLSPKSTYSKVGKHHIYVEYDILGRWSTEFLLGDPIFYADYVYTIKNVSIYVSDTSSKYALMGASTSVSLKQIPFINSEDSKFLKNLIRISGLKFKVKFDPEDEGTVEFIIDGGVGVKNYDGDEYLYIGGSDDWYFDKEAKEVYLKIDSKYRSFNTKGSPKWKDLFLGDYTKQESINIVKQKGYFTSYIKEVIIDYSRLISFVESDILFKKEAKEKIESSLLLLIDASGSMKGRKFEVAKKAAISNVKKAISKNVEVAVAFFGGSCSDANVLNVHNFTLNSKSLVSFIQNAPTMGGTPLSVALKRANEFLYSSKNKNSKNETILLLGDGEGSCGNIDEVIKKLKSNNTYAKHQTIGLEVGSNSKALRQLTKIATSSGGSYHQSASVKDLEQIFEDAADIEALSNMLGRFGNIQNQPKDISNNSMQSILDNFE